MSSKPYESNLKSLSPSDIRVADMDYRADWDESDPDNPSYIANKPEEVVTAQADWEQEDSTKPDFIKNKPEIPTPQVQADWNTVSSDAKSYIKNKPPVIPATVPTTSGAYKLVVDASGEGDPIYSWELISES